MEIRRKDSFLWGKGEAPPTITAVLSLISLNTEASCGGSALKSFFLSVEAAGLTCSLHACLLFSSVFADVQGSAADAKEAVFGVFFGGGEKVK